MLSQLIHLVKLVIKKFVPYRPFKCNKCNSQVFCKRLENGVYRVQIHYSDYHFTSEGVVAKFGKCVNSGLIFGLEKGD